jgi:hypothetical protein
MRLGVHNGATMNRKILIGLMAAVAATAGLGACASAPAPQHTADRRQEATGELGVTRNAWAECVRTAIPRVDDPRSSSEVVARAAMKSCTDQYTAVTTALMHTLAPSCSHDAACASGAMAKAEREATQAATNEVVDARVRVAGAQVLKCE